MHRSLTVIVCAILATQPKMSKSLARSYATVVQEQAAERYFDPLSLVAMAHWESRWRSGVANGQCMGLVGVCLSNYRSCQASPAGAKCQAKRSCLLDGACNLREASKAITSNRKFCRRKTGRARFHHWLASYGGHNGGDVWCGQRRTKRGWRDVKVPPLVERVMRRRRELIRRCAR